MYATDSSNPTRQTQFRAVYKSLTTFCKSQLCQQMDAVWSLIVIAAVIAIILLVITFVFAVIVMRNFGRGLKSTSTSSS